MQHLPEDTSIPEWEFKFIEMRSESAFSSSNFVGKFFLSVG